MSNHNAKEVMTRLTFGKNVGKLSIKKLTSLKERN